MRSVVGYFDTAALPRRLGLQVLVQPERIGPFRFGTAVYVGRDGAEPGAMSLTVLEARSEEEIAEVRERSRAVATQMLEMPGFLGWLGAIVGERMFTATAWKDPDAPAALRGTGAHAAAMERFFGREGIARGGQTGIWAPVRLNGMLVRCAACDAMAQPGADGRCPCGQPLPPAPAHW